VCIQQHQHVTADSELRNSDDDGKMQHSLSDSGKAVEERHTSQTGKKAAEEEATRPPVPRKHQRESETKAWP